MFAIKKAQLRKFITDAIDNNLLKHDDFKTLFGEYFNYYIGNITSAISAKVYQLSPEHIMCVFICGNGYCDVTACIQKTYSDCAEQFYYIRQDHYQQIETTIFFNQQFYDDFLTKENMQKYILLAISPEVKHIAHLKNTIQRLDEFMQTKDVDVHLFLAHSLKTVGMELMKSHRFSQRYGQEYAHNYLLEFPLYVEHMNGCFERRKMEFVFVCDEIYKCYDANSVGNRVVVNEVVMMSVVKFL